jgi:hypothetical protein
MIDKYVQGSQYVHLSGFGERDVSRTTGPTNDVNIILSLYYLMKIMGATQLAAAQRESSKVPLNRAHEVAIPLVECATTPSGEGLHAAAYDFDTALVIQCDSL